MRLKMEQYELLIKDKESGARLSKAFEKNQEPKFIVRMGTRRGRYWTNTRNQK
jgi:hypothetical protein